MGIADLMELMDLTDTITDLVEPGDVEAAVVAEVDSVHLAALADQVPTVVPSALVLSRSSSSHR